MIPGIIEIIGHNVTNVIEVCRKKVDWSYGAANMICYQLVIKNIFYGRKYY